MKKWIFLVAAFALLLLIAACTCNADQLVAPSYLSPYGTTVAIPNPDLAWRFDASCQVENFHFVVSTDPLMSNPDLSGDTHSHYLGFETGIDYLDQDCTTYYWQVTAEASGGSVASPVAYFRTDFSGSCREIPACTEAPIAPVARSPWNGQAVTSDHPQLVWETGEADYEPDNYHFEVAEAPDFATLKISGDTTSLEFSTYIPYLEDCHTYFWRVTAESTAGNTSSDIIQFWTDFEGTCPKIPMCSEGELTAPILIDPIGGKVVTIPNPQLTYQFDSYDCAPESSEFWVSADPDFASYALHGSSDYSGSPFPDSSTFGTGIAYLDDCTTYYWKVQVTVGATTLVSPVETFRTDFNGVCGYTAPPAIPTFAELHHLKSFNIGCSNPQAMFATFVFEEPIEGSYEAHIGNFVWPCGLLQGYDNALICSGPAVAQLADVQVDLFSLNAQEIVLSQTGYSPACEVPNPTPTNSCVPPANGCGQGMEWCNKACECVKQGSCP